MAPQLILENDRIVAEQKLESQQDRPQDRTTGRPLDHTIYTVAVDSRLQGPSGNRIGVSILYKPNYVTFC